MIVVINAGACMYQTFMNVTLSLSLMREHVWHHSCHQHIINVDMLSGSGTDAHIHE